MRISASRSVSLVAIILPLLVNCRMTDFDVAAGDEMFYLSRAGALMPVWVKGNPDSDTVLIFLHGGPGNTSVKFMGLSSFKAIERQCRVVYWDQRCSWFTLGHYDDALVSPESAADDLDDLVDLVVQRYGPEHVVLMGVSWGGMLGTLYLGDPVRQGKIAAWIEVDGAHNFPRGIRLSMEFVKAYALSRLSAQDPERRFWEEALDFYDRNPDPDHWAGGVNGQVHRHSGYVDAAHGYFPEIPPPGAEPLSNARLDLLGAFRYPSQFRWYGATPLWKIDVSPALAAITIPSAILWGRLDGVLPLAMAQEAYEGLGSAAGRKRLHVFDQSAHVPMASEPEAFAREVLDILERVRTGRALE